MNANTPDDLFRLAEKDVTVRAALMLWRAGDCTLEKALIALAVAQSSRIDALQAELLHLIQRMPKPYGGPSR